MGRVNTCIIGSLGLNNSSEGEFQGLYTIQYLCALFRLADFTGVLQFLQIAPMQAPDFVCLPLEPFYESDRCLP